MKNREEATRRDHALGAPRELDLAQGRLRCSEAGAGAPIVFVHGLLVNANLWRKVVPKLSPDFRCIALDLPLMRVLDVRGMLQCSTEAGRCCTRTSGIPSRP